MNKLKVCAHFYSMHLNDCSMTVFVLLMGLSFAVHVYKNILEHYQIGGIIIELPNKRQTKYDITNLITL